MVETVSSLLMIEDAYISIIYYAPLSFIHTCSSFDFLILLYHSIIPISIVGFIWLRLQIQDSTLAVNEDVQQTNWTIDEFRYQLELYDDRIRAYHTNVGDDLETLCLYSSARAACDGSRGVRNLSYVTPR